MNTPSFFCLDNFTTSDLAQNIQNSSNSLINIYPNPSADFLNINLSNYSNETLEIKLTDFMGKVIYYDKSMYNNSKTINVSNYSKGIYFISISNENNIINQKIIIE